MLSITVGVVRRIIDVALLATLILVASLEIVHLAGPIVGYEAVIVRGGSMAPGIPFGSLVLLDHHAKTPVVGDIVTYTTTRGVTVTHRVIRAATLADGPYLEMKGDANATPDPSLVPLTEVDGTVIASAPILGYLLALLLLPSGVIFYTSISLALYISADLLFEYEHLSKRPKPTPRLSEAAS
jgi:signal peptidase I